MRWAVERKILYSWATLQGRRAVEAVSLGAAVMRELEAIGALPPEPALQSAVPLLARLAQDRTIMGEYILPVLEEAGEVDGWYVADLCESKDGSFSLEIFVWPPGARTEIHDHSSWGAYCCVVGSVLEERYERLDDGSRLDYARLKKLWQVSWSREDGISTVLPGNGGIHRVTNQRSEPAVSVHLYGPRMGEVDGRDYDPSRDYVCDRAVA
jgi:predicted metal-dependent enzyme (double-stranded beta helix superfamily)